MKAEEWINEYLATGGHGLPPEMLGVDERSRLFNIVTLMKYVVDESVMSAIPQRANTMASDKFVNLRHMWVYYNGPIPEGKWVIKRCPDDVCSVPGHLYLEDRPGFQFRKPIPSGKARSAREIMEIQNIAQNHNLSLRSLSSIYEISAPGMSQILKRGQA